MSSFETATDRIGPRGGKPTRKRKVLLGVLSTVVVAVILGSSIATGLLLPGSQGKQAEGVGIEGAATITLYGPSGQTLAVWKTHNSLVEPGISDIVICLSNGNLVTTYSSQTATMTGVISTFPVCPGAGGATSLTAQIGVALGPSCTSAYSSCGIFAAASNTIGPPGCLTLVGVSLGGGAFSLSCNQWTATASFAPSALGCATTCTLNDVASGGFTYSSVQKSGFVGFYGQFDDIPSGNFPSPITIASGDSLSVNIQFTVS